MVAHAQLVRMLVRRAHLPQVLGLHGLAPDPHRRIDGGLQAAVHLGLQARLRSGLPGA
jgi:hypothetical protein